MPKKAIQILQFGVFLGILRYCSFLMQIKYLFRFGFFTNIQKVKFIEIIEYLLFQFTLRLRQSSIRICGNGAIKALNSGVSQLPYF
jgi:hypothetical protein